MKKKNVLLIVETSRAFGRDLLKGITRWITENDDWVVHLEDRGLLESTPSWLKDWRGDGIISRTSSLSMAKTLNEQRSPVVELLGNGNQVVAEVRNNEEMVARCAVEHFAQAGFKNFAFFNIGHSWWGRLRQENFEREVRRIDGNPLVFPRSGAGPRVFYPSWGPTMPQCLPG